MNAVFPDPTRNDEHLVSFRYFMLSRILAGYYNSFFPQKTIRVIGSLYCIALSVTVSKILFDLSAPFLLPTMLVLAQWLVNVLVSIITGEYYFFRFCTNIKKADLKMGKSYLSLNPPISRFIWIAIICIKIGVLTILTSFFIFGYMSYRLWLRFFAVGFLWAALNVNNIIHLYIFEIASNRVKVLHSALKNSLKKSSHRGPENITPKIKSIKETVFNYKCLHECLNAAFAPMKVLIFSSFCCSFFKVMLYCHDMVRQFGSSHFIIGIVAIENLLACLMACLPAVFAGQVVVEANKTKIVLADQLLSCEDKQLRGVLEDVLDYMTARPLTMTICRAWRVDMKLPLSFIGLCTTYLIVIIQMAGI